MLQRSGEPNLKLRAIKSECCADNSRNPARDQIGIPRGFNSEYCARCLGIRTLDVMLGGELTDIMRVRRYLDAERGAW